MNHVVVFAPWRGAEVHIGNRRMDRFCRWFAESGWKVTVVRAGRSDHSSRTDAEEHITVRDPLGMHGEPGEDVVATPTRAPNAVRRWLGYALLVPDPGILWARRALRDTRVRQALAGADLILASSPGESALVAAAEASERYAVPFWMDMRDGWLDEPLKPLLKHGWQRWREARLERRCLAQARVVTVTSAAWAGYLDRRYPAMRDRIRVLTNAVDADTPPVAALPRPPELAYAGRIGASRPERNIHQLLAPLPDGVRLTFIGSWPPSEEAALAQARAARPGLTLLREPEVPPARLPARLAAASGIVVASASHASIPAKWFDALAAGRPILVLAPPGSALALAAEGLPQAFRADRTDDFLAACASAGTHPIPERFHHHTVRAAFRTILETLP